MASNADQIGPHVPHTFHALIADVTGSEARVQTAYTVGPRPKPRREASVGHTGGGRPLYG